MKAQENISSVWPSKICRQSPESASHRRATLSLLAVRIRVPWGLKHVCGDADGGVGARGGRVTRRESAEVMYIYHAYKNSRRGKNDVAPPFATSLPSPRLNVVWYCVPRDSVEHERFVSPVCTTHTKKTTVEGRLKFPLDFQWVFRDSIRRCPTALPASSSRCTYAWASGIGWVARISFQFANGGVGA